MALNVHVSLVLSSKCNKQFTNVTLGKQVCWDLVTFRIIFKLWPYFYAYVTSPSVKNPFKIFQEASCSLFGIVFTISTISTSFVTRHLRIFVIS